MNFFIRTDINIFSILILLILLIIGYDHKEKGVIQYRLFTILLLSNIWLLLFDTLGWALDGVPGNTCRILCIIVNVIALISNFIPPILWLIYVNFQVYRNRKHVIKRFKLFVSPVLIGAALIISSPLTRLVFYLDSNNVYHRGPLLLIFYLLACLYFIFCFLFTAANKKRIDRDNFIPLLLFPVPPVIGSVLQALFYGVSFVWSGMTLSIFVIYITIQNRISNTDYLTGLFNRRQLDDYLNRKISDRTGMETFSVIMLDIDDFKKINDTYGHNTGDKALASAANILRSSLREDDFIARYAGDEFVAVLNIGNRADLETAVDRIKENIMEHNLRSSTPYNINFSMGYDIYKTGDNITLEQCVKHVDKLMYKEKMRKTV